MPVEYGSESNYAKESRKWEAHPTAMGAPGRPYVFREYPKRMYKAEHIEGKGIEIVDAQTADDADQERNLLSRGFCFGQDKAFEAARQQQTEYGTLAAEREYAIRHGKLSEKAIQEVRAAEAEHGNMHMPDVPVAPIKRRGRPPKAAQATT